MFPIAILDRRFHDIGGRPIRQHHKPEAEIFMDVPAHERIHFVTPRTDGCYVVLRQRRQDKPVGNINAELVSASATARVAVEARIDPLRRVPLDCPCGDPSSRHADIDQAAILVPDRVYARAKRRNGMIGPIRERAGITAGQFSDNFGG
jgi:hypothetical protein